ncbi:MAG: prepilin-type N-terminal cleavage/methylation domain-containing protein [Candidatus Omnitrophica bacterium]|nr:prepilin-type N-terminal cleavage/methylation domain-containing protein [Candidatus Omnitrophota bacterium]
MPKKGGFTILEILLTMMVMTIIMASTAQCFVLFQSSFSSITKNDDTSYKYLKVLDTLTHAIEQSAWVVVKDSNTIELHSHTVSTYTQQYVFTANKLYRKDIATSGNTTQTLITDNLNATTFFKGAGEMRPTNRYKKVTVEFWEKKTGNPSPQSNDIFYIKSTIIARQDWNVLYAALLPSSSLKDGTKDNPFADVRDALAVTTNSTTKTASNLQKILVVSALYVGTGSNPITLPDGVVVVFFPGTVFYANTGADYIYCGKKSAIHFRGVAQFWGTTFSGGTPIFHFVTDLYSPLMENNSLCNDCHLLVYANDYKAYEHLMPGYTRPINAYAYFWTYVPRPTYLPYPYTFNDTSGATFVFTDVSYIYCVGNTAPSDAVNNYLNISINWTPGIVNPNYEISSNTVDCKIRSQITLDGDYQYLWHSIYKNNISSHPDAWHGVENLDINWSDNGIFYLYSGKGQHSMDIHNNKIWSSPTTTFAAGIHIYGDSQTQTAVQAALTPTPVKIYNNNIGSPKPGRTDPLLRGILFEQSLIPAEIYYNEIHDLKDYTPIPIAYYRGTGINVSGSKNLNIHNNLFLNNYYGIYTNSLVSATGSQYTVKYFNNAVVNGSIDGDSTETWAIKNCIVWGTGTFAKQTFWPYISYSDINGMTGAGGGKNIVPAKDPLFINLGLTYKRPYDLKNTNPKSPCKGKGNPSGYDMGAYRNTALPKSIGTDW